MVVCVYRINFERNFFLWYASHVCKSAVWTGAIVTRELGISSCIYTVDPSSWTDQHLCFFLYDPDKVFELKWLSDWVPPARWWWYVWIEASAGQLFRNGWQCMYRKASTTYYKLPTALPPPPPPPPGPIVSLADSCSSIVSMYVRMGLVEALIMHIRLSQRCNTNI